MITQNGIVQPIAFCIVIIALIKPMGWYMAKVYSNEFRGLTKFVLPLERLIYRILNIDPQHEMSWRSYLFALLLFNTIGFLMLFLIQHLQGWLPLNPQQWQGLPGDLAFNIAASFVSNTNWQNYVPEQTLSYFTQMLGLNVQNFLSAATGMSVLIALIRSIVRQQSQTIGNFWVDMVRTILYILLPLSVFFALLLVTQGVIQNFHPYQKANLLQPLSYQIIEHPSNTDLYANSSRPIPLTNTLSASSNEVNFVKEQILPMGPVASQVAIKQLGSNGGGFFNTNSAHPFENPTPFSNFIEELLILLIPISLCYTYGMMVGDKRQGWSILAAMVILFIPLMLISVISEQVSNPLLEKLHITNLPNGLSPGGNMEGKESRFGVVSAAFWAAATTATSNGSVNSMLDSLTPLSGLVSMLFMTFGEVIFGGVGSGLYSMLIYVILTTFIAGLMIGRTPEYLGKKVEAFEMKMAAFAILLMPFLTLLATAVVIVLPVGNSLVSNPGIHGFSEIFYAFLSMANNNGSAFAGFKGNTFFINLVGGLIMLISRFGLIYLILAIAGSLAQKKKIPITAGTLPTHGPLFIGLLISTVILIGALTFFPSLMLGPIAEELTKGP